MTAIRTVSRQIWAHLSPENVSLVGASFSSGSLPNEFGGCHMPVTACRYIATIFQRICTSGNARVSMPGYSLVMAHLGHTDDEVVSYEGR